MACICVQPSFANPLEKFHRLALDQSSRETAQASDPNTRRFSIERQVAALNSLGRSAEALERLDPLDLSVPLDRQTTELRAKVFFALDRCADALPLLDEKIKVRDKIGRELLGEKFETDGYVIAGVEELLAKAYCHVREKTFDKAVESLSRIIDPFDPKTRQHVVACYLALRSVGAQTNPRIERQIPFVSRQLSAHAVSLALLQKQITFAEARAAIAKLRLDPSGKQDALAEILFFRDFAEGTAAMQMEALLQLNALAPYGLTEWMLAKYLFKP